MGKFDNAYGTTAFGSPERQFLDKVFLYTRLEQVDPQARKHIWTELQRDFTSLNSAACNNLKSKFPVLKTLGK
ncbi:hypothetical protein OESDEN_17741 [Oesophagostomum dentatum]|uniref:Uncharacterized protein n=1 Tax=Oesophagostomum dentatum TaxID=61180 RepID=A0A0B1SH93_OESDE|nr:hypothetical protein OESDEN_17741 [Oesophagostomum dentatum]